MNEDRRCAGYHMVRVACSRPARRVTYGGMSLTCTFVARNRGGSRHRTRLTATVTATRTDTSARRRTPKRPGGSQLNIDDPLSSNGRPRPRMTTYGRRERTRGPPSGLKGATRRPATALRASLDPGDHHGPTAADTTGQAPDGTSPATAPPCRQQVDQNTEHRAGDSDYGRELVQICST